MNVKWINHNNKKILYVDYRGLNEEQMLKQLEHESNLIMEEQDPVLYLANFEGTIVSNEFMNKANELGKSTELKTSRSAVIGVTGMKKVLLNTYSLITRSKMKAFANEAEAKLYLTS